MGMTENVAMLLTVVIWVLVVSGTLGQADYDPREGKKIFNCILSLESCHKRLLYFSCLFDEKRHNSSKIDFQSRK